MLKKMIFSTLTAATLQSLSAFDGFYVGGSIGGNATRCRRTDSGFFNLTSPTLTLSTTSETDLFDLSPEGSLFIGYGSKLCQFYLGTEAFVRYTHAKLSSRETNSFAAPYILTPPFNNIITLNQSLVSNLHIGSWHYGIDGRIGFFANACTLIYGRLGVECTTIKLNNEVNFFGALDPAGGQNFPYDLSFNISRKPHSAYLRAGLGVEKSLNESLHLRADYVFTNYGNYTLRRTNTFVNTIETNLTNATKIRIHNHAVTVGLSYYFNNCPHTFCCCNEASFCGFYVNGAVGGSISKVDASIQQNNRNAITIPPNPPFDFSNGNRNSSLKLVQSTFLGLLSLGFGNQWKCFYLGLEGFGQYANHDRTLKSDFVYDFATKGRVSPWQFGVDFRPGFVIKRSTLVYGAIGVTGARIEGESTFIISNPTFEFNTRKKDLKAGLRVGAGVEYALNSCWHIRGDYRYTNYGSIRLQNAAAVNILPFSSTLFDHTKLHFSSHDVTIGLSRYF